MILHKILETFIVKILKSLRQDKGFNKKKLRDWKKKMELLKRQKNQNWNAKVQSH